MIAYIGWKAVVLKAIFDNHLYNHNDKITLDMLEEKKLEIQKGLNNLNQLTSYTRTFYVYDNDVINDKYLDKIEKNFAWLKKDMDCFVIDCKNKSPYYEYDIFPFLPPICANDIKNIITKYYGRNFSNLVFKIEKENNKEM